MRRSRSNARTRTLNERWIAFELRRDRDRQATRTHVVLDVAIADGLDESEGERILLGTNYH